MCGALASGQVCRTASSTQTRDGRGPGGLPPTRRAHARPATHIGRVLEMTSCLWFLADPAAMSPLLTTSQPLHMTLGRPSRVSGDRAAADRTNSRTHGISGAVAPGARLPFVLPIASWVSARRTRARVAALESVVAEQTAALERLSARLLELGREIDQSRDVGGASTGAGNATGCEAAGCHSAGCEAAGRDSAGGHAAAGGAARPLDTGCTAAGREATASRLRLRRLRPRHLHHRRGHRPRRLGLPPARRPRHQRLPSTGRAWSGSSCSPRSPASRSCSPPCSSCATPCSRAGCSRPCASLIGILVAISLLVLCELKAARKYAVTANALDAAAIAILFSTFFAAHALWHLIPAAATFGLLAIVTALAVLLSDSPGVPLHRSAGPARRLCHAGAPLDGREPADSALRLSAALERRPRVGCVSTDVACAHRAHAHPDDDLSVGLGLQVPVASRAVAGAWESSSSSRS